MLQLKKFRGVKSTLVLFSGGLDTSFLVNYLSNELNLKVYTLTVNLGQTNDSEMTKLSQKLGAHKHFNIQATKELVTDYCTLAIKANGRYYDQHPLCSSLSRPLIAKIAVKVMKDNKIQSITHGSHPFQNTCERFERAFKFLTKSKIFTPFIDQEVERSDKLAYLKKNKITANRGRLFSSDENIWGFEIEDHQFLDPAWVAPESVYKYSNPAGESTQIELTFREGVPVKLNGKRRSLVKIAEELNRIGGRLAIGRFDCLEDRILGNKAREIHEMPAAHILITAHKDLELSMLPREILLNKSLMDIKWGYNAVLGYWFSKEQKKLNEKIEKINKSVNGTSTVLLEKKHCSVVGRKY